MYTDKNLEEWLINYQYPSIDYDNKNFIKMQIYFHKMVNAINIAAHYIDQSDDLLKNLHRLGVNRPIGDTSIHLFNNKKELIDCVIQLKLIFGETCKINTNFE